MFKIGDFSRLAQVSVKALRHYDRLGLLRPAWIDRFSGYRYYAAGQLPRLNRILALKELGFSLAQVRKVLDAGLPLTELQGMLRLRQSEVERQIKDEQARLERLAERLRQIEQEGILPAYDVVVKPIPAQPVIGLRQVIPSYVHLPALFAELDRHLGQQSLPQSDAPRLAVYYDAEYRQRGIDVEAAVPLTRPLTSASPLEAHPLPGVERAACAVHQGSYERLPEAYSALMGWIETHGYRIAGPNRDVYLQAAGSGADEAITEVQFPVEKRPTPTFFSRDQEIKPMGPQIVTRPAFTAVGLEYYGKNEKNEIAGLWGEFNPRIREIKGIVDGAFGLCLPADESGAFKYLASIAVSNAEQIPAGMEVWQVPEQTYAVFPCTLPTLRETYQYAFETWLPASGYGYTQGLDFEYYDESFDPQDPDNSIFHIYVPIRKS